MNNISQIGFKTCPDHRFEMPMRNQNDFKCRTCSKVWCTECDSWHLKELSCDMIMKRCVRCDSIMGVKSDQDEIVCENEKCKFKQKTETMKLLKKCPGCGLSQIKSSGCDHMTCVRCKQHWCYRCGCGFKPKEIYMHMSQCKAEIPDGDFGRYFALQALGLENQLQDGQNFPFGMDRDQRLLLLQQLMNRRRRGGRAPQRGRDDLNELFANPRFNQLTIANRPQNDIFQDANETFEPVTDRAPREIQNRQQRTRAGRQPALFDQELMIHNFDNWAQQRLNRPQQQFQPPLPPQHQDLPREPNILPNPFQPQRRQRITVFSGSSDDNTFESMSDSSF